MMMMMMVVMMRFSGGGGGGRTHQGLKGWLNLVLHSLDLLQQQLEG